jgi:hypothetical protein
MIGGEPLTSGFNEDLSYIMLIQPSVNLLFNVSHAQEIQLKENAS